MIFFFMGIYSFPGQFWLEKGVPFMLPEALNPPSTGRGCPFLLFPLSTRCSLSSSPKGEGSPALGMGKVGSQVFRVNCAGVGIAHICGTHKMDQALTGSGGLPGDGAI